MKSFVKKINRGFTMIEMVVVMAIVVVMSMALFANYREIGDQGRVTSFTGKIREDMYLAQNYSLYGKENKSVINASVPDRLGWGVYFNRNLNKYVVFSDLDGDKSYSYPVKLLIHGDETPSAGTFTDSSQSANTITVIGNPAQENAAGMPTGSGDGYWSFDGTGDGFTVLDNVNFNFNSVDFTIDMWVTSATTGSKKYLMVKGSDPNKVFELYKTAIEKIEFVLYNNGEVFQTLTSRNTISADTPTHIGVVKFHQINASTGVTKYFTVLYMGTEADGKDHAEAKAATSTQASLALGGMLAIGSEVDGRNSWSGKIDEMRITKGFGRWNEIVRLATAKNTADEEFFKEVKLPPGLVFDSLITTENDAVTIGNELNVFFDPTTHLMYANNGTGGQDAKITINNAGVADTGIAGDTPQILTIGKAGVINWTH